MVNDIFIDIPYAELKKAITEIEKKKGICRILPHGRFRFSFVRNCGYEVRRVEEEDGQKIVFELIVCEALGGESTGCSTDHCKNCVVKVCKHAKTIEVPCVAKGCSNYGKQHIQCLECGVLVDILKEWDELTTELKQLRKEEGVVRDMVNKLKTLRKGQIEFVKSGDIIYVKGVDGVAHPTDSEIHFPILRDRLRSGNCPNCDVPLVRGINWKERLGNWWNKRKFCLECGFTLDGD